MNRPSVLLPVAQGALCQECSVTASDQVPVARLFLVSLAFLEMKV